MQKLIRDMEGLNQGGKGEDYAARGQLSSAETGEKLTTCEGKGKS